MSLRTVMLVVNVLALAAFGVLAAAAMKRRVKQEPPNLQTYHGDEVLENARLERWQGWSVLFSFVIAASLPLYWLREPSRQSSMKRYFERTAAARGEELFGSEGPAALSCERCHGAKGAGGAVSYLLVSEEPGEKPRFVNWRAPSLNDVMLRFPEEQVTDIINYGRPGTPMPPWGLPGGGPLNTQAVGDLVAYLKSITIPEKDALGAQADLTVGRELFEANCARCHTKGWSYYDPANPPRQAPIAGGGAYGPSLAQGAATRQFPGPGGPKEHADFIAAGSERNKRYGDRGVGAGRMPGFAKILTRRQIERIVEYERGL